MNQRSSSLLHNPPIYAQIWRFAFNRLLYRQRREHTVFNKLLQIIPGLEEHLLNSEASEVTEIAELVFTVLTLWCTTTVTHASLIATKGSLQCPIQWRKRSERGHPWLDHPSWVILNPSFRMVRSWLQAISGLFFFIQISNSILKNRGRVCYTAQSLFQ